MFKMKLITLASAAMILAASSAKADGFRCSAENEDLNVAVYNEVLPSKGTRTAAIMVLSDPTIQAGNKTIAAFKNFKGNMSSSELVYEGKVDFRFAEINKPGRNIGGTKLGMIDTITLAVDFSYSNPIENGEKTRAHMTINKRNGDSLALELLCTRYLKN